MKKKRKSTAYALPFVKTESFLAIMRATECTNFVIEVNNIEKNTGDYSDIVFQITLDEELEKTISNIIELEPEIISVYCNLSSEIENISLETNWDITLEFLLYENVFILSCNYELYENLQLRIKNILI